MERNRGLDLLRLLAGMSVVMLHYNYAYAFHHIDTIPEANRLLLCLMEALSMPAVNIFLLISGFFLYKSDRRSLGKAINLLLIVVFFSELFYLGFVALGKVTFETSKFLEHIVPNSYFITLYCAVYLLSPYVNILIRNLTIKSLSRFLLLLTVIISVEPWLVDELELLTGDTWNGVSTVSHWGGQSGHTLVFFIYMYILGASLNRLFNDNRCNQWLMGGGISQFNSSRLFVFYRLI